MKTTLKRKSLVSVATALALSGSLNGTTYTVTTLLDQNDANCTDTASLSLRDAIACATAAGDIVNFGVTGALGVNAGNGAFILNNDISVVGPGMQNISFSPDSDTSIFSVPVGSSVTISGMTINGVNAISGSKVIDNLGDLTLSDCNISNNQSSSSGTAAGISNTGTLSISNSYIGNNTDYSGFSNGSALYNGGTLTIDASVIEGNTGASMGSALYSSSGTVTITNSTISGNTGQYGGAVVNGSTSSMSISDSNISGNSANYNGGAINTFGTLSIATSAINDNNASNSGGAIYISGGTITIVDANVSGNTLTSIGSGGAVYAGSGGNITVSGSTFENNKLYGDGAALFNNGANITIVGSTFSDNFADGGDGGGLGGAINNYYGNITIDKTTIVRNEAHYSGGGLFINSGSVKVSDSVIYDNNATDGGGIGIDAYMGSAGVNIVNSTISGNSAANAGGGVSAYGYYDYYYGKSNTDVNISHSTIANNISGVGGGQLYSGGGIYNYDSTVTLKNTIVANNADFSNHGPDLYGEFVSAGYNLITTDQDANISLQTTDINGTDPLLLALGDYGGLTPTLALDLASPARGAGDPSGLDISGNPVTTDQRGFPRATPPAIGAFEPQLAEIGLSLASYDFGSVYVGDTSAEYSITVNNIGGETMTVDSVSLASSTPEFGWNNYCSAVPAGGSCTIGVYFSPSDALAYSDTLIIESTGSGLSASVALSGTGISSGLGSTFTGTLTLPAAVSTGLDVEIFLEETDNTGTTSNNWSSGSIFFDSRTLTASADVPIDNPSGYYKVGYRVSNGDTPDGYLNQAYVGASGPVWAFSDAKVFTATELQNGLSLSMLQGLILSGTLSLPSGITTSSDLPVHIDSWYDMGDNVDPAMYDSYYAWEDLTILAGQSSVAYSVTVPDTSYGWRLEYWLDETTSPSNLFDYGFYSSGGTTPYYESATQVYTAGTNKAGLNFSVLSANTVSGTISKPAGYTSEYLDVSVYANTTDHQGVGGYWTELNSSVDQVQYTFKVPTLMSDYKLAYEFFNYSQDNTVASLFPILYRGYYAAAGTTPYESKAALLSNSGNKTGINLQMLEGVLKTGTFEIDQATLEQYYGVNLFAENDTDRISSGEEYDYDAVNGVMSFGLVLPSDLTNFRIGVETYTMDSSTQGYLAADGSTVASRDGAKVYATVSDLGTIVLGVISSTGYSGTITLPATLGSSLNIEVYAEADHEWYGNSYTFSPGETSKNFTINVPDGLSDLAIGYAIQDTVTGLVRRGYYTGSGTTAYENDAATYSSSSIPSNISLDILQGTSYSGTVSFPSGFSAADGDELDIIAVPKAFGGDVFRRAVRVWIEFTAGETGGSYMITVPDNDISSEYYLGYDFFDSNDFVRQGYYGTSGATGFLKNATLLDTADSHQTGLDMELLKGVGISGTITSNLTLTDKAYLFVRATRDDGEEFFGGEEMSSGVTSYPFTVKVPTDTSHTYKLGYYVFDGDGDPQVLDNAVIGFWSSGGTVTNKADAGSFAVASTAVTGKNMTVVAENVQSVSVNSGWNLLSLPSKAELSTLDLILHFGFRADDIDYLAKYDGAGWSYYFVDSFDPTQDRFTSIRSGEGFWLKANRAFTMQYALSDDADYANEVKPLSAGWNLVGVNSDMTPGALAALYDAYNIESMWIYKSGTWSIYIPNATIDTLVDPTIPRFTTISKFDGVWIRVKGGAQ